MPDAPAPKEPQADQALQHLAAQALAGDESAFETLYRRLHGGLHRFLLRRVAGSAEVAEELAQRAWVEVWRAFQEQRYDPTRAAVTTYVYAIGYKIWLQHCRRQ